MLDMILNTTLGQILDVLIQYWPVTLIFLMWYSIQTTWTSYLAVMHLKEERERLVAEGKDFTKAQKFFGIPLIVRGLIIDVMMNILVGTVCFLEPPRYDKKEFLFTGRVSRWNDKGGIRGDIARAFCADLLDPFEKGGHCS